MSFDGIGPEYVIHVYDPQSGMRGVIVLDSTKLGPAKGGIRMAPSADEDEVRGLARAMTLKTALADLPFGGGKSGIIADPKKITPEQKEILVKAFAHKLSSVAPKLYVAAPDIAMAEKEMRIIAKIAGKQSVTGKPKDLGGIPHELGSTGFGVAVSVREAFKIQKETVKGKTISVQGFGNVGTFAAKHLCEWGAILVSASDSTATLTNPKGLDTEKLIAWKEARKNFSDYHGEQKHEPDHALTVECDVLIPCAQKHVITMKNIEHVKAKMISQGANLPMTHEVELLLEQRGIINIPDILANSGGVISSYVEWKGGTEHEIFDLIEKTITKNIKLVADSLIDPKISTRDACVNLALQRIHKK